MKCIINNKYQGQIREAPHQRTTTEKWIGYKEEGSFTATGRDTSDRIEGSELQDNETPSQHKVIWVLAYTRPKWIVDPGWHICTHENAFLRKVNWNPLQWTWCDPYAGQGSKPIPFFQFTTRLGCHIIATQTARDRVVAKV